MPIIFWSEKLSVGVEEIDAHHKGLVSIVNQLHDAIRSGKADRDLGEILDKLVDYTGYHFRYEEDQMSSKGYAGYEQHREHHQALLGEVLDLQTKFRAGQIGLSLRVITFLKDWLTNHILGDDKKMGDFLAENGIN